MLCYVVLCCAVLCCAVLCCAVLCCAVLSVALRCVALRCVALRCVALRCVALCCVVMLCYVILYGGAVTKCTGLHNEWSGFELWPGSLLLCSWARHFTLIVPLSTCRCINGYRRNNA